MLASFGMSPALQVAAQVLAGTAVASRSLLLVPLFLSIDFLGASSFGMLVLCQAVSLLACLAASQFVAAFFLDARFAALVAFVLFLASPFFVVLGDLAAGAAVALAMLQCSAIVLGVAAPVDAENWPALQRAVPRPRRRLRAAGLRHSSRAQRVQCHAVARAGRLRGSGAARALRQRPAAHLLARPPWSRCSLRSREADRRHPARSRGRCCRRGLLMADSRPDRIGHPAGPGRLHSANWG